MNQLEVLRTKLDDIDLEIIKLYEERMEIVKKVFSLFDASIGATVDLSSGTQIYRQKRFWESGVRWGTDVTCNDFINQLGL